ncbi:MAG: prepilin-type N-terminal cleavage/methylation domain-containing protein [Alphaproteobacteria bacterium]|nr:prepilin-type N-terminal cleavage/methylation domain-containing protein [Alphaproteobacteria bacterium]
MTQSNMQARQSERGFTLVELAIVMIIIGLLIGGILKGQELIGNARISSSISQIKAIEVGVNTFRDKYAGMPGDLLTPQTRIPNCLATDAPMCARAGDGNSQIGGTDAAAALATADNENSAAMAQMVQSDMMGGVDATQALTATSTPGVNLLASNIAGSYKLMYDAGGAVTAGFGDLAGGHWVRWDSSTIAASLASSTALTSSQAARVDRKLDDGNAAAGSVIATGTAGAAAGDCASAAGVYNESFGDVACALYVRISQ